MTKRAAIAGAARVREELGAREAAAAHLAAEVAANVDVGKRPSRVDVDERRGCGGRRRREPGGDRQRSRLAPTIGLIPKNAPNLTRSFYFILAARGTLKRPSSKLRIARRPRASHRPYTNRETHARRSSGTRVPVMASWRDSSGRRAGGSSCAGQSRRRGPCQDYVCEGAVAPVGDFVDGAADGGGGVAAGGLELAVAADLEELKGFGRSASDRGVARLVLGLAGAVAGSALEGLSTRLKSARPLVIPLRV